MTPKFYPVLQQCIESGIQFGLTRAFKHDDSPSKEDIASNIEREIMTQLHEWFNFKEEE